MKRRLMAILLSLTMALSLLPTSAFAHDGEYQNAETAYNETGVTATKTATVNSDGTITITLTVKGTTSTDMNNMPADVVLVIDSSGSMDFCTVHSHEHDFRCYTEKCTKESNPDHWQYESGLFGGWKHIDGTDCKKFGGALTGSYYCLTCDELTCENDSANCISRMYYAKEAAKDFVDGLLTKDSQIKVGLVEFAGNGYVLSELTNDAATLKTAINNMVPKGGTNYGSALSAAENVLKKGQNKNQFVVLVSDGEPDGDFLDSDLYGTWAAARLQNDGVTIMTVGIEMEEDSSAEKALEAISSSDKDGKLCYTGSADALSDILAKVIEKIDIHAGTNAVMTDVINTESFELVELEDGEDDYWYVNDDGELVWNIGDIGKDEQEVSFTIKLKDGEDPNTAVGQLLTNDSVSLTFNSTKQDGEEVTFGKGAIGEPYVLLYQLSYDANGGTGAPAAQTYGVTQAEEWTFEVSGTELTREGYSFMGWATTATATEANVGKTFTVDEDEPTATVYAVWEANEYTVTWVDEDGETVLGTKTFEYGTTAATVEANEPADPTKESTAQYSYEFDGWTPAYETVTGDKTYKATYKATYIDYTVTYTWNLEIDGLPADETYHYNDPVTVDTTYVAYESTATVGENTYVFTGWSSTDVEFTNGKFDMPANDVTITGVWELDNLDDPGDKPTGGDKIPDKYQALVVFDAKENGTVTGEKTTQVFTLRDADGNYAVSGQITPTLEGVEVKADDGYDFYAWTKGEDTAAVNPETTITVAGNSKTTFWANFIIIGVDNFYLYDVDGNGTSAVNKNLTGKLPASYSEAFSVEVRRVSYTDDGTEVREEIGWPTEWGIGTTRTMTAAGTAPFFDKKGVLPVEYDTNTFVIQEVKGSTSFLTYDTNEYYLTIETELSDEVAEYTEEDGTTVFYRPIKITGWYFSSGETEFEVNTPLTITNQSSYSGVTPNPGPAPTLNTADHYAYVVGYPDGTVQPQGDITRAEVATIFFRLLTDESRTQYWKTTNDYSDVAEGDWYNNAISTLSNAGILSGYPDGTFRPDAPITRAEMAKIVAIFAELEKSEDMFSDIAGHWAEAYIKLAAGNGWINGYPDGSFKPQQAITRAETMTMINRVLNRVPENESRLLPYDEMLTFPDCLSGEWYYIAVQEATNSHTYQRVAGSSAADEQWIALRENRDWTKLEY